MFWRSVVGKLAITILLLVSFVLFILSILLLEFFEGFHVQEEEKAMQQSATKISLLVDEHDDDALIMDMVESVKDPSSRVIIYFDTGDMWVSETTNKLLKDVEQLSPKNNAQLMEIITEDTPFNDRLQIEGSEDSEIMVIGQPMKKKT